MRIKIASQVPVVVPVTSGTLKIVTLNGKTMFFHNSIDFSQYAGWDGGYTPYLFSFTDAAGKVATAYSGSRGGGEAYNTDALLNWDFTDGWSPFNSSILDSDSFSVSVGGGNITKSTILTIGLLYKINYAGVVSTGSSDLRNDATITGVNLNGGAAHWTATSVGVRLRANTLGAIVDVTTLEALPLTDIPSTGLHLVSAKNGTTRNMTSVESGFNPNTVVSVSIQRQRVSFLNVRP